MFLFAIIVFVVFGYALFLFNKFISLQNKVFEAWSGIDVQLKRRHDLIPNLVETVKSYSTHEQETLTQVVELRSASRDTAEQEKKADLEKGITADLKKIIALAESYPDLKADKNFRDLQKSLTEIEDHLQYARRYYNGTVRDYNTLVESAPSNLIAKAFSFERKPFFEIELATERSVPEVDI